MQSARAQMGRREGSDCAGEAAVEVAKAAVETAGINLGFTRLTTPMDGIPGIAHQQVGALVSPASGKCEVT
jgi:membrane fusion protein (multidrug efflux system)